MRVSVDGALQFGARREADRFAGLDLDFFTGAGIDALAGLALHALEGPQIPEGNGFSFFEAWTIPSSKESTAIRACSRSPSVFSISSIISAFFMVSSPFP